MNGWWIGLLVVLALCAGAGAIAWVQAALVCSSRHRAARHSGSDSGAGPADDTGPGLAPAPDSGRGPSEGMGPAPAPEQHHERREPWYQEHGPIQLPPWEQRPPGDDPYAGYQGYQRPGGPGRHRVAETAVDGITGLPRAGRCVR